MMPAGVAAEGRASRGGARGDTEGEGEGWSATVDTCSCRCWPGTTRALASRVCLLAATAAASTFALARPSRRVPRRKDRKTEEGGGVTLASQSDVTAFSLHGSTDAASLAS